MVYVIGNYDLYLDGIVVTFLGSTFNNLKIKLTNTQNIIVHEPSSHTPSKTEVFHRVFLYESLRLGSFMQGLIFTLFFFGRMIAKLYMQDSLINNA